MENYSRRVCKSTNKKFLALCPKVFFELNLGFLLLQRIELEKSYLPEDCLLRTFWTTRIQLGDTEEIEILNTSMYQTADYFYHKSRCKPKGITFYGGGGNV